MSSDAWDEIERIFGDAITLAPDDRRRLLDARCADQPALRAELESLLASHDRSRDFLHVATDAHADGLGRVLLEHHGAGSTGGRRRREPGAAEDRVVAHYRLVEWIGAGGMGDVYRAEDLALGRRAALKLLPQDFSAELRLTLLAEAEASAKLQHPAIATFYEAGEADGEAFLAMEFVEGDTLRERLKNGPVRVDEAVPIISCLLEALAHAHAAGLLHRDIKPDNVILAEPRFAKLLDFGIAIPFHVRAPLVQTALPEAMTVRPGAGPPVGTIGYLAPEQLTGGPLDVRTDLFQVGVVLYEMLTGRPAFRRESWIEGLTAAMTGAPDLAALDDVDMPRAMPDIVRRALARDPTNRYESAAAFLRDLRAVDEGRVAPRRTLVAVADFENQTGDNRLDWLGSAVAASIHGDLAALEDLKVSPRAKWAKALSAGEPADRDPVAASLRLGCSWLVRGETQAAAPGSIQVIARLVEVTTGRLVSTHDVVGPMLALFALQRRLSAALAADLSAAFPLVVSPAHDTAVEAHECFTRARLLIEGFGKGSLEDARHLLERAVGLDDRHVGALGALATTYGLRAIASPNTADYEHAVTYANRALAVDPRHVGSLVWKGYALAALGRHAESEQAVQQAVTIDPHDTEALYFAAGTKLLWTEPPAAREARDYLQRAITADDQRGMWWLALGCAHRCLNRPREALHSFARAARLEDTRSRFNTAGAAAYVGDMLRRDRRWREAHTAALAGLEAAERSDHAYRDTFRAHALNVIGRIALDEGNPQTAAAAFGQVLAQARGRPQPRACGHLVVQALCGIARATREAATFEEALRLIDRREPYNFDPFYGALVTDTWLELSLSAAALGRDDEADAWFARGRPAV